LKLSNTLLRLQKRLESKAGKAIADYRMIEDGDTILVCISGGKDSYTLLSLLMALRRRAPIDFRLIAMNLDQKQPGFPAEVLPNYLAAIGIDYRIVDRGHLLHRQGQDPRGQDHLLAVLPPAPRHHLPHRQGTRRQQSRSATTATTCSRPCSSTCSSAARSRPCRPSW